MTSRFFGRIPALALASLLSILLSGIGGCAGTPIMSSGASRECLDCGVIESITPREVDARSSPGGAIAGAIIGGIVGHQFGSGHGQDAATAAGAVGGAVAGNEVGKRAKGTQIAYEM